jgi:hypothetical protein
VLVLVAGVAGVVLVSRTDWAQNQIDLQFHTFQDSRGVTVLAPVGSLDKDFTDRTGLRVKFGVDAITAASDSCARCHANGANSRRSYVDFGVRRKYGDLKLDVGAEFSRENFYSADTGMVSISRDFNHANTTVAGAYSFSYNQPTLHPSQNVESQISQEASVSLTQILSKSTILQLTYDVNRISGFQTNVFLRTPVNGVMLLGQEPDLRTRHALVARIKQALPAETYLEADYRRYVDSWSVASNAVSVGLSHAFTPSLLLGFSYRYYGQTGAFFYQPVYVGSPQFFTGDFRLAPFDSGLYGGRIVYTPKGGLPGLPAGTSISVEYQRYLATTNFQAAVLTAGIKIPLK